MAIINGRGRVGIRRSGAVAAASYLLDTYSGSAVAYSLRKLSLAYSGSAIRVRRSSDNAEQNIGFDASGNLDTTALTSFVGAGNGFVTTWYDQSGNGRNATQTTAGGQPQIVSSGVVLTANSKPSLLFNGSSHRMPFTQISSTGGMEAFCVCNFNSVAGGGSAWDVNAPIQAYTGGFIQDFAIGAKSSKVAIYIENNNSVSLMTTSTISNNITYLCNGYGSTASTGVGFNNFNYVVGSGTRNDLIVSALGQDVSSLYYNGKVSEIVLYPIVQTANRSNINTSINTYYSIYNTVFPQWNLNSIDGSLFLSALQNDTKSFNTGSTTTFGSVGSGTFKWLGGVLAPNGKIYCIPRGSTSILQIDPTTNTTTTFGSLSGTWAGGVLAPNGKIYCIPYGSSQVLVIDPTTNTTSTFGSVGTGNFKWTGGVLAPNGKIYCIPFYSTQILVIDPTTNTTSLFGTVPGNNNWYGGVLAPNGKIYCIPASDTQVLVIDPTTNTTSLFGSLAGSDKWYGGVLAPNGKIYCIPTNSTQVLVIDPTTNTTSLFGSLSGSLKWIGGVLAPNGKIYGIPYNSVKILEINPNTNTTSLFGSVSGPWNGGVLASNGKIYGVPYSATNVLAIGDTQTMDDNRVLSRYMNKSY